VKKKWQIQSTAMATLAQQALHQAFRERNVELSVAAHAERAEEKHAGGAYIKSLVYGGLDGIITTFAIVCAAVGAGISRKAVVVMGFASLVADAMSMGLGDTLSEMAERDFIRREWERETWEMDTVRQGAGNARALRSEGRFRRGRVAYLGDILQVQGALRRAHDAGGARAAGTRRAPLGQGRRHLRVLLPVRRRPASYAAVARPASASCSARARFSRPPSSSGPSRAASRRAVSPPLERS